MGHSTATIRLQATPELLRLDAYGLVLAALSKWRDEEADRWDSARAGDPVVLPLSAESEAERFPVDAIIRHAGARRSPATVIAPFTSQLKKAPERLSASQRLSGDQLSRRQAEQSSAAPRSSWGAMEAFATLVRTPFDPKSLTESKIAAPKAEARRIESAAKTVYAVQTGRDWGGWSDAGTHPSRSAAEAACRKLVQGGALRARVVKRLQEPDGSDAAITEFGRAPMGEAEVKLAATRREPLKGAKIEGWLISFDYHH